MCSPLVMSAVRAEWSRRGFLGLLASAGLTGCSGTPATDGPAVGAERLAAAGSQSADQGPVRLAGGFRRTFDLTHPLSPATPVFSAFRPMQFVERFTIERDGFTCGEITLNEHTGTHMDAPIHFVRGGDTVDRIPADRLFAPLAVISIADRAARNPDAAVTVDDVLAWEARHGRLPAGAFVAMASGWDARFNDPARFLNADASGTLHAPGFSGEAASFLATERDITGVGVDTVSLDVGAAGSAAAHLAILGAGKYGVEVIANLGAVPPTGAMVIVGGPKHVNGTGGPVRLLAVA